MKPLLNFALILSCLFVTLGDEVFAAPGDMTWVQTDTARPVIYNGTTNSSGNLFYANWYGTNEFQVVAKDKDGNLLWNRQHNPMLPIYWSNPGADDALIADDNFIYLAKTLVVLPNTNTNYSRLFIAKISAVDGSVVATYLSPADSYFSNQNAVAIDETGLYLGTGENSSGGIWKIQKFTKNLSLVWSNTSAPLGTNDEIGPKRLLLNGDTLYAGGTVTSGVNSSRLDIYDKNTGIKLDTKIQNGAGSIGSMTVVDSNLYTTVAPLEMYHLGVPLSNNIGLQSTFQRRDLLGNVLQAVSFPYKITSLAPASLGNLYLAYTDDAVNHLGRFKVVDSSGSTTSTIINTGVVNQGGGIYRGAVPLMNNLVVANNVIYWVGRTSSSFFVTKGKIEAYSHLAVMNTAPATPVISGPATGTVGVTYDFVVVPTGPDIQKSIRYGVDENGDDVPDSYTPNVGYALAYLPTFQFIWLQAGNFNFRIRAEDDSGGFSSYATHNIAIQAEPRLIICPATTTLYTNQIYELEARYWSSYPNSPHCGTPGYTNVTQTTDWSSNSSNTRISTAGNRGVLVTLAAPDTATVRARYSSLQAERDFTVRYPDPIINLTLNSELVRSGATAWYTAEITANYNVQCTVLGVNQMHSNIVHVASPTTRIYDGETLPLSHAQVVQITCTADGYPDVSSVVEKRVMVVPTIREI